MHFDRRLLLPLFFTTVIQAAFAQDNNLQPKYGLQAKNEAQRSAETRFLSSIDEHFSGNRKMAAEHISSRGWQLLGQGNTADAMRRFNQAWLLDNENGSALWGMATVQANTGQFNEALKLFVEAERIVRDDLDFSVDYAKTLGFAGARTRNHTLLRDAFSRFERLYQKAPQHTLNLQNWAITLFHIGNYAEAWKKLKLAEATPRRAELDPSFVAALQSKITRH